MIRSPPRSAAFVFLYSLQMGLFTREYRLSLLLLSYTAHSAHFFFPCYFNILQPISEGKHECLLRKNCARARARRESETFHFFFLFSRVLVLCGQLIASVVSPYKRDENRRTEAIGTRSDRDALSFLCTTHFPRVLEMCL